MSTLPARRWVRPLTVTGILVGALLLRLWCWVGPSMTWLSDDSRYISVVQNMANGYLPQGPTEWFATRFMLLGPTAALFRLFGGSDVAVMIWPLIGSLGAVGAAYLLGRDLVSARVGLIAATVVAITPLEARLGTFLRPDAIMPALVALSVWCAVRARSSARHVRWWAFAAGALLVLGWSARESALLMAPVVLVAGWPVVRKALLPGVAGALAVVATFMVGWAVIGGRALDVVVGAGSEGEYRNPIDRLSWRTSYARQLWESAFRPDLILAFVLPILAVTAFILLVRRRREAILPAIWLTWAAIYLEFGTLVNLGKPSRYLTLCVIPVALLIALAIDGRFAWMPLVAAFGLSMWVLWAVPGREFRADDVQLLARVSARLSELPPGPIATESYTWWAKLNTYRTTHRLSVPRALDREFVSPAAFQRSRQMRPLPKPTDAIGGYVVTGPVHRLARWPTNWKAYRTRLAEQVPFERLELVADLGRAKIWRWPKGVSPSSRR